MQFAAPGSKDSDERNDNNSVSMTKREELNTVPNRIRTDISSGLNHFNLIEVIINFLKNLFKHKLL